MQFVFDPEKILSSLGIKEGDIVADFGAGSGHLTIELAKLAGKSGKVYALDVLKPALESIRRLADLHKVFNIETVWADLEKTAILPADSCDFVVMANFLFQVEVEGRKKVFQEAKKILKKGGRLLILERKPEAEFSPNKEQWLSQGQIKKEAAEFFELEKEIDAGPSHWGLLFKNF